MKNYLALLLILITSGMVHAQSKTTEALHKKSVDSKVVFFYKNTLRMLNQSDDKSIDELIKDIEKMKILMVDKAKSHFDASQYKKLVSDYKAESFEEIMTSRYAGKNFDVYVKEEGGKTKGMIVTVNDTQNLMVLDIVGSIALNKVGTLFSTIEQNTGMAENIRAFLSDGKDNK